MLLSKGLFDAYFIFGHLPVDENDELSMSRFSMYAIITICITGLISVFVVRDEKWYLFAPLYLYIWGSSFVLHWHYVEKIEKRNTSLFGSQPLLGAQVDDNGIFQDRNGWNFLDSYLHVLLCEI